MATHAHTTPAASRRRFAGALLAIGAGTGITAGAAASVADFAQPEPDGYLVTLCNEYVAADREHEALSGRQQALSSSDREWHRLDDLASDQGLIMRDLEPRIAALTATSPEGVEAKARAVARMSRFYRNDNGAALLRSLLADLLPAGRA